MATNHFPLVGMVMGVQVTSGWLLPERNFFE